ncbi:MAG TPA: hypothetical protein VF173_11280, partial [Thermoanaerobaculia bacterium]|nr:hypothetical protein [Thermoanaerobaculia bacterium]
RLILPASREPALARPVTRSLRSHLTRIRRRAVRDGLVGTGHQPGLGARAARPTRTELVAALALGLLILGASPFLGIFRKRVAVNLVESYTLRQPASDLDQVVLVVERLPNRASMDAPENGSLYQDEHPFQAFLLGAGISLAPKDLDHYYYARAKLPSGDFAVSNWLRVGKPAMPPPAKTAPIAAVCGADIVDFRACHENYPTGCSQTGNYDAFLNFRKNLLIAPSSAPVRFLTRDDYSKLEQSLPRGLDKTNHQQFQAKLAELGEGQVVSLAGYLYSARKSGKESNNCELMGPDDTDFHIGIGFDSELAAKLEAHEKLTSDERIQLNQSSVITEMTPHWRAQFKPVWTLAALKPFIGRQVRVVGPLMVDNEHYNPRDDCAFPGAGTTCWRASTWEIHPVTRFEVCSRDSCSETGGGWVELEDFPPPGR